MLEFGQRLYPLQDEEDVLERSLPISRPVLDEDQEGHSLRGAHSMNVPVVHIKIHFFAESDIGTGRGRGAWFGRFPAISRFCTWIPV